MSEDNNQTEQQNQGPEYRGHDRRGRRHFKWSALVVAGAVTLGGAIAVGHAVADEHEGHKWGGGYHHADGDYEKGSYGKRGHHGMRGREILKMVDSNGDQAVTQEEIDGFVSERIATHDGNQDGVLSLDEFEGIFRELVRSRMVDAFQHLDDDGDGSVTRGEIDTIVGNVMPRLDRNEDGIIDKNDRRWFDRFRDDDDDDDDDGDRT